MVFDWIKRKAQEVQDAAARSAYRSAFERLRDVAEGGFVLDFDASSIPTNLSSIDLSHARSLGTADRLKSIAKCGELIRDGVQILQRGQVYCSTPPSMRGAVYSAINGSLDARIQSAGSEDEARRLSDAKSFLHGVFVAPDWFSRPVHGLSPEEKAVLRAAHFWQARGLVDSFDAAHTVAAIVWQGDGARYFYWKGSIGAHAEEFRIAMGLLNQCFADEFGSYQAFIQQRMEYFRRSIQEPQIAPVLKFDDGALAILQR